MYINNTNIYLVSDSKEDNFEINLLLVMKIFSFFVLLLGFTTL